MSGGAVWQTAAGDLECVLKSALHATILRESRTVPQVFKHALSFQDHLSLDAVPGGSLSARWIALVERRSISRRNRECKTEKGTET